MSLEVFYGQLGFPDASKLDRRVYKRLILEHGQLTSTDKKSLSKDVRRITWKYTLKASTVQVLPYEDSERAYLEVAVVEVVLSSRSRAARLSEMIQRAIPYPVLLVMAEGSSLCVSVAHKRFSRAEKGSVVAEDFLLSPWIGQALSQVDESFCEELALRSLSQVDFYALYQNMVGAVLARNCAELTGTFVLDVAEGAQSRRRRLEQCLEMERAISSLRGAVQPAIQFARKVELNTRIKELEARLAEKKAGL